MATAGQRRSTTTTTTTATTGASRRRATSTSDDSRASTSTTSSSTTTSTTLPPTTTTAPFDVAALGIADGDPFARLEIPRMGRDDIVVAGVGREELKKGPGHYPQTPMPGQLGNAAIAGHRTTYGGPFLEIDELEPGDEIIVTTPYGRFVYLTTTTEIVDADDWQVIATIDPTVASLDADVVPSGRHGVAADHRPRRARPGAVRPAGTGRVQLRARCRRQRHRRASRRERRRPDDHRRRTTSTTHDTRRRTSTSAAPASTTSSTTTTTSTTTSPPQTLPADTLYSVLPGGGTIGGGRRRRRRRGGRGRLQQPLVHRLGGVAARGAVGRPRHRRRRRRLLPRQALPQQLDRPRRRPSSRSWSPCTSSTRTSTGCCRPRCSRTFAARRGQPFGIAWRRSGADWPRSSARPEGASAPVSAVDVTVAAPSR